MDDNVIICRCQEITYGEIVKAIEDGAISVTGVKKRVGSGMGSCQGKYCEHLVAQIISEKTGISLEEIYGIATFYSQFKLNPDGQIAIAVCLGTACYVKGSGEVIEEISKQLGVPVGGISEDGRYSLDATRCIGACGLAPVLTINGEVYGRLTKADVATVLAKYRD